MTGDDSPEDDGAGLTDGDYERIRAFADLDVTDRDPDILVPEGVRTNGDAAHPSRGVPPDMCRTMRRRMSDAETVREVMEEFPQTHTSEVMKHVYGECNHDHATPPTASPQIHTDECRAFRERYASGEGVSGISDEFYRADNTVTRHIFGRCSHPPEPRPLFASDVEAWECRRLRETFRGNPNVGVEEAATAMRLRPRIAEIHLSGDCECENDAAPVETVEW